MSKSVTLGARLTQWRDAIGASLRNAPLFITAAIVSVSVDVFAWAGIFATNTATADFGIASFRLAWPEAIMSVSCTLAALILSGAAAAQKSDPRRTQRERAGATQILAVVVLAAPIYYAGLCGAVTTMRAERAAYIVSEQFEADRRDSRDQSIDSMARRDAADRLGKATPVVTADAKHLIPSMAWVAFLLGANMAAVRFGWRAMPETAAETQARVLSARARQAHVTRQANIKAGGVTELAPRRRASA